MRPRAIAIALLLVWSACAAQAETLPELVRSLNSLQNRMAKGDANARQEILKQSAKVNDAILSVEPEGWRDERNVRAAALYLLSGGDARALREIFDAEFMPPEFAPLLDASLRHAEGRTIAASKALLEFDARAYPRILGGHIALVQGGALLGVDKPKALSRFDLARLLTPESLVEEAALRRQIGALDPFRDASKFVLLATRYAGAYSASPYAQIFWRTIRSGMLTMASAHPGAAVEQFDGIVDRAEPDLGAEINLMLARMALLDGRFETSRIYAKKAESKAQAPALRKRAELYRNAVAALTDEGGGPFGVNEASGLSRDDAEALMVVTAVTARFAALGGGDDAASEKAEAEAAEPGTIAASAQHALENTNDLLARASRR